MYGIGELNTQGTLPTRSMGGVGVAMRNSGVMNLLNPASYSVTPQKSVLFDFGVEGQNYYNAQTAEGATKRTAYNTFNFHDIAFQLPLAKKLGLGFSLTPYSSVGYRVKYNQTYGGPEDDPIWGNVGRIQYQYQGEGDVTEVKLGVGWEVVKNLSVGIVVQYYWGDIDRTFVMTPQAITGDGNFSSTVGTDNYSISSFKGQLGVQWNAIIDRKRLLTVGATYDFGGDLNPTVTKSIYVGDLYNTTIKGDTTHLALVLPRQLAVGVYYQTSKWAMGVDYVYQNWGGRNGNVEHTGVTPETAPDGSTVMRSYEVAYTDTHTVKLGVEYTPNRYDIRNFFKRWAYRLGLRYGTYHQTFGGQRLDQMAVTFGMGVPVKYRAFSSIDVGVEYGMRGFNVAERLGLVRQQYIKFSIGFTLFAGADNNEYWFLRPKYD